MRRLAIVLATFICASPALATDYGPYRFRQGKPGEVVVRTETTVSVDGNRATVRACHQIVASGKVDTLTCRNGAAESIQRQGDLLSIRFGGETYRINAKTKVLEIIDIGGVLIQGVRTGQPDWSRTPVVK